MFVYILKRDKNIIDEFILMSSSLQKVLVIDATCLMVCRHVEHFWGF
jgi:hypothetical protein